MLEIRRRGSSGAEGIIGCIGTEGSGGEMPGRETCCAELLPGEALVGPPWVLTEGGGHFELGSFDEESRGQDWRVTEMECGDARDMA